MNQIPKISKPPAIAVFDFDNTLTKRDSLLPFLRITLGRARFFWGMLLMSSVLTAYALKLIPNWRAKEAVLTHFLSGIKTEKLNRLAENFAVKEIPKLLRSEAVQRLRYHQEQGHYIILVSASLEAYLIPWANIIGIDRVIGTKLETQSNILTGRIQGKNCYGLEKVERLTEVLGDLSQYCIYAYGDSRGDREMLNAATFAYYRKFHDTKEVEPQGAKPRWERGLILSVIAAAVLYLGIVLWSGAEEFWAALNLLPTWLIPALLAIVFLGYCLRFLRWHWYLHHMGYPVPWKSNFQIFLSSFALTASPGKAGESIKSLLLKRRHNVPVAPTLAGLFCERFTDALSVVLLTCLGLASMAAEIQAIWAILALAAIQVGIILLLQHPHLLRRYFLKPLTRIQKLKGVVSKVDSLIGSASILLKPKLLFGSTLIALIAWGLEGVALYYIFQYLEAESITLYQGVLIHTASGLIGALSMLPGGIGGAETASISLSTAYGATQSQAVAATLLIRLITLWFAIAIGIFAMLIDRK
ncbi:MAG: HAD-IB family hydrolase [Rivularia sp. (in: cyanobacteria)]